MQLHVVRVHVVLDRETRRSPAPCTRPCRGARGTERDRALDVRPRAVEIALQHDPHVLLGSRDRGAPRTARACARCTRSPPCRAARTCRTAWRASRMSRMIDTHSSSAMSRPIAVSFTRHVRVELLLVDAVEHVEVLRAGGARLGLVGDALAEQVERRGDALRVERAHRRDRRRRAFRRRRSGSRTSWRTGCSARSGRSRGWLER